LHGKTIDIADGGRLQLVPSLLSQAAKATQSKRQEFSLILKTLERIHAISKQHMTHCLVIFFPSKEEIYLPLLEKEVADLAASFISELDKRGISYLDLGPIFRQRAAAGETLFWEVDGHPNPRGYALIADVVLSHLKENAKRYGLNDGSRDAAR
jgi:hypothetical protein